MNDRDILRGLLLVAISLVFGLQALRYPMGDLSNLGPGSFPLIVSCLLFSIGITNLIRARGAMRVPTDFRLKNVGLIALSLIAFTLVSEYMNMIAGIVVMVVCASFGAFSSVGRVAGVAVGLTVTALVLQRLFQLQLPLY